MSRTVDIVCAADERFALPLAVTLSSAAATCSQSVRAFILTNEFRQAARKKVEATLALHQRRPEIIWVDTDADYIRDLSSSLKHLSSATYLRLAMGRMLADDITRVIYLDSDTLILQDLADLFDTPLHGKAVGAVRDYLIPIAGMPNSLGYCLDETGLTPLHPIFNAGVLLIDLTACRALDLESKCKSFLQRWAGQVRSADQDALNLVLSDNWQPLDFKWNVQVIGWKAFQHSSVLDADEKQSAGSINPAIYHYVGSAKPWNSGLRSTPCKEYVAQVGRLGWFSRTDFKLWKARRVAAALRTVATNQFNSLKAGRG